MPNRPNLIGFGAVAVDDLLYLDAFPEPDSKLQIEAPLRLGGGLAGTALVAASRLGADAAYCGVLGDDELSVFTKNQFKHENVRTNLILSDEIARPLHSTILVDRSTGSRTILFTAQGFRPPAADQITPELFTGCEMIFIDTFALSIMDQICELAGLLHIQVLADIEDLAIQDHPAALDAIDHLIFNINLAAQISGQTEPVSILNTLESHRRQVTVITAGDRGCWYKVKGCTINHFPAFPVNAVDTTGCGDVFHGAYAAAILRGSTIPDAVRQASAAAAIKAESPGGREGIPAFEHLTRFLGQHTDIQPMELT